MGGKAALHQMKQIQLIVLKHEFHKWGALRRASSRLTPRLIQNHCTNATLEAGNVRLRDPEDIYQDVVCHEMNTKPTTGALFKDQFIIQHPEVTTSQRCYSTQGQ
jgi:hypothetical protein